jgi:hypothetical protein
MVKRPTVRRYEITLAALWLILFAHSMTSALPLWAKAAEVIAGLLVIVLAIWHYRTSTRVWRKSGGRYRNDLERDTAVSDRLERWRNHRRRLNQSVEEWKRIERP